MAFFENAILGMFRRLKSGDKNGCATVCAVKTLLRNLKVVAKQPARARFFCTTFRATSKLVRLGETFLELQNAYFCEVCGPYE